jgi:hypothetical protein
MSLTVTAFANQDTSNKVLNTLEALQNLAYLIEVDADNADNVTEYALQLQTVLSDLHRSITLPVRS